tara:strand:+ start:10165 stop:10773 length:609 start_codon:yes stop_codon:yes gene_type:complete
MLINNCEQGSTEWHALRQGNVTGTSVKDALGSPVVQKSLLNRLVAERMTEPDPVQLNSPAVLRGIEQEPFARDAVILETGMKFEEVGCLVSEEIDNFSFSPDGLLLLGRGGLEIKCPSSKKHVEYMREGGIPKEYYHQVMTPFLMSDKFDWWLFASYDDRNYDRPLYIYKATRDDFPKLEDDREKLKAFLNRVHEAHTELCF